VPTHYTLQVVIRLKLLSSVNLARGLSGAHIVRSNVWLSSSEFQGQGGRVNLPFVNGDSGNGGSGLYAENAMVTLARTALRGAKGAGFPGQAPVGGGNGLLASGSILRIAGGTGHQIQGAAALDASTTGGAFGSAGAGIGLLDQSVAVLASDVIALGGLGAPTIPAAPAIVTSGVSSTVPLGRRLPSLAFAPTSPFLGQAVVVQYEGEPNSLHVRALWLTSGQAVSLPGVEGSLLLDLGTIVLVESRVLDANGQAQTQTVVPLSPGLLGISAVEQSLQISPPHLDFGPPAIVNVR